MSSEANYSLTVKVNGDLLTVRGGNSTEFSQHLDAFLLSDDLINKVIAFQSDVRVSVQAQDGAAQLAAAETALAQGGITVQPGAAAFTPTADPSLVAPTAPPTANGAVERVPGKFAGQFYTYNVTGAPLSANGPMLLLEAVSKAGKPYRAWVDPLEGPKPAKKVAEKAPRQYIND